MEENVRQAAKILNMKFKRGTYLFLIIIIFLACILTNMYVLNETRVIRRYDEADRISESITFSKMISNKEYRQTFSYLLKLDRNGHPKLVPFLGGISLAFLTQHNLQDIDLMILFTNAVFIFILLFSVYKISFLICNNKIIGLFSVFFLLCSPMVFGHSRILMLDLPLAAMVSLCFLTLLKTRNFKSFVFSIFTGIVMVFAQLTKEASVIFIFPLLLYYFFKSIYIPGSRRQKIINFTSVVFIFFTFISLIYFRQENQTSLNVYLVNFFSTDTQYSIFHYLKCFPVFYLGLLFSIAVVPITIYSLWKIKKENKFLIFWFLIPLLIFTLSSNKDNRYMLPLLPAFFLLVTLNIFKLPSRIKKTYITILVFCSLAQYIILNYLPDLMSYPLNRNGLLCMKNDEQNKDFCIAYNTRMFLFKERDFYVREKIISFLNQRQNHARVWAYYRKAIVAMFFLSLIQACIVVCVTGSA